MATKLRLQYLYGHTREAVEINGREPIYFWNLEDLEESLFLAGYGELEIDDIICETAKARETGFGDDLADFFEPSPRPPYIGQPYPRHCELAAANETLKACVAGLLLFAALLVWRAW